MDHNEEPNVQPLPPEQPEEPNVQPLPPAEPEATLELRPAPQPETMAAPEPEPEPAVAAAPALDAEPEPEPEPETTSLLKKEISFRRKPKPKGPKKKASKPAGTGLKREISLPFTRKSKSEQDAPAEAAEPKETKAARSGLKKEISLPFKRKPKSEQDVTAGSAEPKEKKPARSGLKKEISFSFKRKPKAERAEPHESDDAKEKKTRKRAGRAAAPKRAKRLVGLKIGGSQLAAARIVNNGAPELVQVAREDLPQGIVVNGELREPELLADALRAFFRKHKLPRQGVRLGIANNRIGVRIFEIAGIDDPKQLENAVRFRAQEALPIPIEEAVLDYHVLGERVDDEGMKIRRILLVVAYRELIDRYVAACKKAGVRLAGIDLEAFALLRALGEPQPDEAGPSDAALVVVAIGHDRSTFAVSDGRACEFTRVLDWGGATLDVAIARELDCAPSEAEPVKRQLSLTGTDTPEGLTQEQAERAREAVRRQLQTFARELVSSLQFYQNQPGSLGIGEIVITGGSAHLGGVADELQKLIGVRVAVGDPLMRVKLGKKLRETEQLGSLSVAIGLGIED
jgi:type IV pilus assembly protein PilM